MGYVEYIEQIKNYIMLNWSAIVEYTAIIIAYFLFFLYQSKVRGTKRDMTVMFKEKAATVTATDTKLRKDIKQVEARMEKELSEAKENYANAVNEIAGLRKKAARMEAALHALLNDDYDTEAVDDGK